MAKKGRPLAGKDKKQVLAIRLSAAAVAWMKTNRRAVQDGIEKRAARAGAQSGERVETEMEER